MSKASMGPRRRHRLAAAGLALAGVLVSIGVAAPAQASGPYFQIYYSPGCTGASKIYTRNSYGVEPWINDTFNNSSAGSGGLGQRIRNNAASVRFYGVFWTVYNGSQSLTFWNDRGVLDSGCQYLAQFRNHNTNFYYVAP